MLLLLLSPAAAIKALSKQFGKWHGISSLINLGALITGARCCASFEPPLACLLTGWSAGRCAAQSRRQPACSHSRSAALSP